MTKQHFIALATEISRIADPDARRAAALAVANVARGFNDKFDKVRFMTACGARLSRVDSPAIVAVEA